MHRAMQWSMGKDGREKGNLFTAGDQESLSEKGAFELTLEKQEGSNFVTIRRRRIQKDRRVNADVPR